ATTGAGCREEPDPAPAPPPPPALATSPGPRAAIRSVAPELGLTVKNYPRVDGSTSAQPLLMMTACRILAARYDWLPSQDDSRQLWASGIVEMAEGRSDSRPLCEQINELVQTHGTGEAYVNLIRKNADLIVAARLPSADESRLAGELDVRLDAQPVALDA